MRTILAFALIAVCVTATPWDGRNTPSQADATHAFSYGLKTLPTSGTTATEPWSDTYWPSKASGIAHRWLSSAPQDFSYTLNTKDQLHAMTSDQIKMLSPAEKYDIFVGRYDYPTVQSEWSRTSPDAPGWEGLCHGWAPASLHYQQPNPVTLTNADNITIPFGSSDIKALLIYWTGEYDKQSVDEWFVAGRCNIDLEANPSKENTSSCADVNAGTLHVLLSNLVGTQSTGFVVDRDRSIQVWNQPVFKYSTSVTGTRSSHNGVTQVAVHTAMSYGKETYPQWEAHAAYVITEEYDYTVDVDGNGNIVGGDHISWDRPDFIWMQNFNDFYGYFANLSTIYSHSVPHHDSLRSNKAQPRPALASLRNHQELTAPAGTIGVQDYPDFHRQSWSLRPAAGASSIILAFSQFDTERNFDKVRIYEGADGNGALVAVLHGSDLPKPVTINADGALVVFTSDSRNGASGFTAFYVSQ